MFGSCVAVFVMAMLYEGLKVGRELLLKHSLTNEHMAVPSSDVLVIQPARSYRLEFVSSSSLNNLQYFSCGDYFGCLTSTFKFFYIS